MDIKAAFDKLSTQPWYAHLGAQKQPSGYAEWASGGDIVAGRLMLSACRLCGRRARLGQSGSTALYSELTLVVFAPRFVIEQPLPLPQHVRHAMPLTAKCRPEPSRQRISDGIIT